MPNTLLGPIFAVRGHGEIIHTRRPRESDPRAGRTPVSCVSDRGRHRSVQWNPEKTWCVRREVQWRGQLGRTDGRITREGQRSSRGLSSPPPLEPLGPGGCCLDLHRRRGGQKETPERSPRSLIHSADPHHPAGLDKTNLVGLICATTGRFLNCVVKI